MTGTEYVIEDPAPSDPRAPGSRTGIVVAALTVVALIVGVVVAFRQDTSPVAAPPEPSVSRSPATLPPDMRLDGPAVSDSDEFGVDGIGRIRVGMSDTQFASLYPEGVHTIGTDVANRCRQLLGVDAADRSGRTFSVWVRDGVVETVAIRAWSAEVRTALGPAFGAPLDRADPALADWAWDTSLGVPVARLITPDRLVTLADVDALDGEATVGYATTSSHDGGACSPSSDQYSVWVPTAPPDSSAIEGTTLGGVTLGATEAEVAATPGWSKAPDTDASCNVYTDGHGGEAHVRDVVTGLSAPQVIDGPAVSQSVAEAVATVDGQLVSSTVDPNSQSRTTVIAVADGRTFTVGVIVPFTAVEGLDSPVRVADSDPKLDVVARIDLGQPCANDFSLNEFS